MAASTAAKTAPAPKVKPIPDGFHSVTPHLTVVGAAKAIEFYKKAFGAVELSRAPMPHEPEKLMNAMIRIGDSIVMLVDEFPEFNKGPARLGGSPVTVHLYVPDTDATIAQAVAAGAKVMMPAMDAFWGDRYGVITDPFGHNWSVATHQRDLTPDELAKAAAVAMANHGGEGCPGAA